MKPVVIDMSRFHGAFFDEADEHLGTMEATLLELESAPTDRELLDRVFRAAHSIKGASGTFGFDDLAQLTHVMEGLLDRLREGELTYDTTTSALLLRAVDGLRGLLVTTRAATPPPSGVAEVREELRAFLAQASAPVVTQVEVVAETETEVVLASVAAGTATEIVFVPGVDTLRSGMDPLLVVRDACDLGEVEAVEVDLSGLPAFEELDPESSYLGWTIRMRTEHSDADLRDAFAFVEDSSRVEISHPVGVVAQEEAATQAAPEAATQAAPEAATAAATQAAPAAAAPAPAASRPAAPRAPAPKTAPRVDPAKSVASTVRVSTEKLDRLFNLVGELVIAQSMVVAAMDDNSRQGPIRLREAVSEVERNMRDLQDGMISVRMVPISTVFNRFPRVVHDLAASLGKKIHLAIEGEETELDKGMVELLADPLTHLVRNAVDHGIEMPDDRVAAGKPAEGVVTLRAYHQGGSVIVEVADDGRGLQTAKIREKALALGLIGPNDEVTADQINSLIFGAGFSTASEVTSVSGRGVGMDVVRRNVEAMSGAIGFTTKPGVGSAMRVKMPLTMAIMEGLSLRVGTQTVVVPLTSILESFRPTADQINSVCGRGEMVSVRGEPLPLVRVHRELGIYDAEEEPTRAIVCVVESGHSRAGLLVDELLGQAQVVVKSLATHYRKVDGITGATILGDGKVALIVDVPALVQNATATSKRRTEMSDAITAERFEAAARSSMVTNASAAE